jgi:hypothetical protein
MRIRTVKPEFWTNETMARRPEFTRLLALALINYADDEGYFLINKDVLRGSLFPFLEDSGSIPGALRELSGDGYLTIYADDKGRPIGHITKFSTHQKISKPTPSKIKGLCVSPGGLQEDSGSPTGVLQVGSGSGSGSGSGITTSPKPRKTRSHKEYPEDFESFWKAYPRKEKKDAALKAWIKADHKPSIEEILVAVLSQRESPQWTKDGGQFIPHPSTWINGGQWNDEVMKLPPIPVRKNYI